MSNGKYDKVIDFVSGTVIAMGIIGITVPNTTRSSTS